MHLFLIRHGRAGTAGRDADRALTSQGVDELRTVAGTLRRLPIPAAGTILSSPLTRARETAALLDEELHWGGTEIVPELSPGAEPFALLRTLAGWQALESIALVGHQPDLGHLLGCLLTGAAEAGGFHFRPGSVALVSVEILRAGQGRLEWFFGPPEAAATLHD